MPNRATSSPDLYLNQLLSQRYRLLRLLGQGAMGRVYLAQDQQLGGVTVAVKLLSQALVDQEARLRFEREAQACAYLGQKSLHIVRVNDYGLTDSGVPFYVMEYLNGRTLRDLLRPGPLPLDQVFLLARQIGLGLKAAHEGIFMEGHTVQVVHRDLKPGNVLVVADDSIGSLAKIVDFGIAKLLSETGSFSVTHAYMGTLAYSSPEQLEGLPLDPRSDIYSFGIMMYEMVSGVLPILPETDSFPAWYHAHLKCPPRQLDPRQLDLPRDLEQLILACLQKSPQARPQSIAQVISALDQIRHRPAYAGAAVAATRGHAATRIDAAVTQGTQRLGGSGGAEAWEDRPRWWERLLPLAIGGALGIGSFFIGWQWLQSGIPNPNSQSLEDRDPTPISVRPTPEPPPPPAPSTQERPSDLDQLSTDLSSSPPPADPQTPPPQPPSAPASLPIFAIGIPQVSVRDELGPPQESGRGFWPNTTYDLYRFSVPDQGALDLGLIYDRDTLALRQTEATVTDQMSATAMQEILSSMLQAQPPQEILAGLQQVRARVRDTFEFRFEILEGTIERNAQGRIYIATWEPGLHNPNERSSRFEIDFQFDLGSGSLFGDSSIPAGETLREIRREARERRD